MTIDQTIAFIKAIAELCGVLIWPTVALTLLFYFREQLAEFVKNLGEFSFKAPGVEATAKRKAAEAGLLVGAATASKSTDAQHALTTKEDNTAIAGAIANATTPRAIRRLESASVLWVDDRPENNRYERRALEALGIQVTVSTSTEDALAKMKNEKFNVVVSDMNRPPDSLAGYKLLDKLKNHGDSTPFIIYASSRAVKDVEAARNRGAIGCTNRPQELIEMILQTI